MSDTSQKQDKTKVIDVTVPLQCLVKDSKLILTEASKVGFTGSPCLSWFSVNIQYHFMWTMSACRQGCQAFTTPVSERKRAWNYCTSSEASCIKSFLQTLSHYEYLSKVSMQLLQLWLLELHANHFTEAHWYIETVPFSLSLQLTGSSLSPRSLLLLVYKKWRQNRLSAQKKPGTDWDRSTLKVCFSPAALCHCISESVLQVYPLLSFPEGWFSDPAA